MGERHSLVELFIILWFLIIEDASFPRNTEPHFVHQANIWIVDSIAIYTK